MTDMIAMTTMRKPARKLRAVHLRLLPLLPFFGLLLAACANGAGGAGSAPKEVVIGIANESAYAAAYGDYLSAAFPDVKVTLVEMEPDYKHPLTDEQYARKLSEERPDLLLGYDIHYERLAAGGLLEDLSPRMIGDKLREAEFYPGMIEKMKRDGGGGLYAVSPTFQASALYYNADLFRQYGVPLPRDGMTMKDVFMLAAQFGKAGSGKEGVVGYHQPFSSMPNNLLFSLSTRDGLRPYDFRTGKVTMDTASWREVVETVVALYKNGTFAMQQVTGETVDGDVRYGPEDVNEADLFKKGKSAMTIGGYNAMQGMPFELGMVTPPVSSAGDRSEDMGVYNYMAIPAGAEHSDTAWEMIRFMLGDYVAKVRSGLQEESELPTRKSYMQYDRNPLLPKLYEILPGLGQSYSLEGYDPKFTTLFSELEDREIAAAVKGERSVDGVIAAIQKEGQALMDAAKPKK
ncbi:ABC transporter substrate-binding protein [Paenibacillus sp. GCM10023250]|uniref:ABC transporter substrate-binding protein n=1 Tax=Paenibacillus sp. GCM10023250 TaxID=3252648 RepID=UPI00360C1A3D